ncbi:MAG: sn-glycerol-3-phosphate ABC transporter ATP-binding protein UgpC [Devosia sp.]|nr:sn-glycerol-3-phosphate ABC transporter ATP-binding protein UgpC [Devosia sp.]
MNAAVSIRDVDIAYGTTRIVADLDLEIAPGEFIVLLGPSGCGKSTLLNAIAGLTEIADGEIWISGRNATWAEPKDRGIGMVFQSYALYPRMSVADNLSFGLRVAGLPKTDIAERVSRAAEVLQLGPLLKRRPSELSGGQRQRVAIGRALVRDVDVFLFDEPLSNLDAKLRAELRVEIKRLHQRLGNTMIYVTHDQVEAMTLADRIAVMRDGVIQQLGTPAEIYHRPANLFVAGFIGAPPMNMIEGELRRIAGKPGLEIGAARLPLDGIEGTETIAEAQRVVLGVRPEQVTLRTAVAPGAMYRGTVNVVEPMGADTVVWFGWHGLTLGARMVGDFSGRAGDAVGFDLELARASLFDAPTGERLGTG